MYSAGSSLCKVEVGVRKIDSPRYLMKCMMTVSSHQATLLIPNTIHGLSSTLDRFRHKFQARLYGPISKERLFPCGADVMLGFCQKTQQIDVLVGSNISCCIRSHHRKSGCLRSRDAWGSTTCFPGEVPDVSVDDFPQEERFDTIGVSFNPKLPGDRNLKLISGSCYLPHPKKAKTGGEDAHFISNEHAVGVADGVGGWADLGIDAGYYARELMSHSVSAIEEEPKGSIDPARVLEKAYISTKARGSSTACIIALTNQVIHAVNLGDSGFIIIRDGRAVFRSPVQQHDFNFTYQLESGNASDLPSSGQVFTFPVIAGDVIVAGTDGLFDNLYNNEVASVVVHATRDCLGPQVAAQKIAALARQRAQDRRRQTPFSAAAQESGYRYYGGKLDDITVVVSYVTAANS